CMIPPQDSFLDNSALRTARPQGDGKPEAVCYPCSRHGSRVRDLREEAVLRQAGVPLPPPDQPKVRSERPAGPGPGEWVAAADLRLHQLPEGRQGSASRLDPAPRSGTLRRKDPPRRIDRSDALPDGQPVADGLLRQAKGRRSPRMASPAPSASNR